MLADMRPEELRTALHEKSADEILGLFGEAGEALGGMYFAPFVLRDGTVIVDREPLEALASGQYNRVPVIVGTNRDEHRLFQAFTSPHVSHIASIPLRIKDKDRYQLVADYGSRLWKASGADEPRRRRRTRTSSTAINNTEGSAKTPSTLAMGCAAVQWAKDWRSDASMGRETYHPPPRPRCAGCAQCISTATSLLMPSLFPTSLGYAPRCAHLRRLLFRLRSVLRLAARTCGACPTSLGYAPRCAGCAQCISTATSLLMPLRSIVTP